MNFFLNVQFFFFFMDYWKKEKNTQKKEREKRKRRIYKDGFSELFNFWLFFDVFYSNDILDLLKKK
jgi:hypothetical protein